MALQHTDDSNDDKGDAQYLSHIYGQRGFEGFLNLLGVFNEEAECKDIRQAEAEVPSRAYLLWHTLVEIPHETKQKGIGNRLVKLSRMAWHAVDALKDKRPGHIGHLADNL